MMLARMVYQPRSQSAQYVQFFIFGISLRFQQTIQADYRRSKVATKLKVIYVKDTVLDVRQPILSLFNPHFQYASR